MVVCVIHNRYLTENLKGHSFARSISKEEEKLIVDLSKTLFSDKRHLKYIETKKKQSQCKHIEDNIQYKHKFKVVGMPEGHKWSNH